MSVTAAIRQMLAAGLSIEQALIAAEAFEQQSMPAIEHAELTARQARNARYYQSRKERLKASEKRLNTSETSYSDAKVSPSSSPSSSSPPITPLITTPPSSPPSKTARDPRQLAVRAAFDAFWRRWPHKVGKPAAEKAFAKCSGEIEAILLGIDSYIRDKPPDRPWLNPATFLNQRRWEDAPAGISSSPSQKGGFASLLAKSMGMKNGQSRRDPDEAVHVLPLDYRGERGDSRDDDRGVSGDVIDLLAVRSG